MVPQSYRMEARRKGVAMNRGNPQKTPRRKELVLFNLTLRQNANVSSRWSIPLGSNRVEPETKYLTVRNWCSNLLFWSAEQLL